MFVNSVALKIVFEKKNVIYLWNLTLLMKNLMLIFQLCRP